MASGPLQDKLVVPTRIALIQQYGDDFIWHSPDTSVDAGTLPNIRGTAIADLLLPVFAESVRQADIGTLQGKADAGGSALDDECIARGLPTQLPPAGASGFVTVATSSGGAKVQAGDSLKNGQTGKLYQATVTGIFLTGQEVAVTGSPGNTGVASNVVAGTPLQWTSPRSGMNGQCTVFAQSDGSGLTGGADAETPDEQVQRIKDAAANPAAAGNDASYQKTASQTPGLAIQQAFTYPCCTGPGVSCLVFLLRPSAVGGTRIPNSAEIGQVKAWVTGQMAKDDSVTYGLILPQVTRVVLQVTWADGIASWTDGVPWPPTGVAGGEYTVQASPAPTPTVFAVAAASSPVQPQVGQTVAVWDRGTLQWYQKRILSISGAGPWTLTIDPSNSASDTTFTPVVGGMVSPWSDSMSLLASPFASYFDGLGPGEQISTLFTPFFDEGFRQKRSPASPQFFPNSLSTRALIPLEELPAVGNVEFEQPIVPLVPAIGTLGTTAFLLTLGDLAIYPT